jgi:D-alanyl-D-alanine carboxypeptidase
LSGTVYVNDKEYAKLDLEAGVSRHYTTITALTKSTPPIVYISSAAVILAGLLGVRKFKKNKYKK